MLELRLPIMAWICFVTGFVLIGYYLGLKKRLERFKVPVDVGYNFITSVVIPDLRKQNNKWRKKERPKVIL